MPECMLESMPQEYHIEMQQDATAVVHPPRKVRFRLYGKLKIPLDLKKVIKREHNKIPTVDKFLSMRKANFSAPLTINSGGIAF